MAGSFQDITKLKAKLAGKPSKLGNAMIPLYLFLGIQKVILLVAGVSAIAYVKPIWDGKLVTVPHARKVAMFNTLLQLQGASFITS